MKMNAMIRAAAYRKVLFYAKRINPEITRIKDAAKLFLATEGIKPNKKITHFIIDLYKNGHLSNINPPPKKTKVNIVKNNGFTFYETDEWNEIRKAILKMYGIRCMKCGATNCEVHVDHIKPRSLYPELELCLNNLQVLCKDCNMEKSNKNFIDYRPKPVPMFRQIGDIIPDIINMIDSEELEENSLIDRI